MPQKHILLTEEAHKKVLNYVLKKQIDGTHLSIKEVVSKLIIDTEFEK